MVKNDIFHTSDAESLDGCYLLEIVEIDPSTRQEVNLLIKNLKPKKAPGFDLITSEILAEIPKKNIRKPYITFQRLHTLEILPFSMESVRSLNDS